MPLSLTPTIPHSSLFSIPRRTAVRGEICLCCDFLLASDVTLNLPRRRTRKLLELYGILSNSPVHFSLLVTPPLFYSDCQVVSSNNGIICLANSDGNVVHLWNPTIRQCRKLPEPTTHTTPLMGFGYDSESNAYKVLRIVLYVKSFDDDVIPIVQLYSTDTNCWKEFRAPILQNWTHCSKSQIVVNGVLYFVGVNDLVSFDLCNEVFGRVLLPASIDSIEERRSDVLDFEGSVALVFECGSGIDLWTLDDVSGHVSWTKSFSISQDK